MAAPAVTVRLTPAGVILPDGYQTLIAFARAPTAAFWEKTVQPPGLDGGDSIDLTTMHNQRVRTKAARQLYTMTDCTLKVGYDPKIYSSVRDTLLNENGAITVKFSDGSTLSFFGYLQKLEPSELSEGEMPEATITIVPTNYDPVNKVEAEPVLTEVVGT